jgi:hypothetical protein
MIGRKTYSNIILLMKHCSDKYMASNNSFENSSILAYMCVDFPLFHFIIIARTNCITIPLVKCMCLLLLPYVTLTNFWCRFFNNIYIISLYIYLLISRKHVLTLRSFDILSRNIYVTIFRICVLFGCTIYVIA